MHENLFFDDEFIRDEAYERERLDRDYEWEIEQRAADYDKLCDEVIDEPDDTPFEVFRCPVCDSLASDKHGEPCSVCQDEIDSTKYGKERF